jgi:NAD(P)-dependent dehydrogenase (short-subunit alcohol dehydrogenase family)
MSDYRNKTAVVLGGTHGIGLAIAHAVVAGGGRVLVTGRNEQNIAPAREALGPSAIVLRSDASQMSDIAALPVFVEERLGAIDALFLNLGVSELEPFEVVSEQSFDRQFTTNTKGVFFLTQRLSPLVRDGGALVFTTVTPATGTPTMSVYFGTKGAVRGFARVIAAELVTRKIRVNAVAPGFIDTPTLGVAGASAEERAALATIGDEMTPMKRHGRADEVARAALFLAFEATFTTGAELPVDGGLAALDPPR